MKKAKINLATKYRGSKERLTKFLTQVQAYIQYYNDQFANEESKVYFVASYLEGQVLCQFEPILKDRLNKDKDNYEDSIKKIFKKYANFVEEIEKVFRDIDKKRYIQERLTWLRQTKSAIAYTTLFYQDLL